MKLQMVFWMVVVLCVAALGVRIHRNVSHRTRPITIGQDINTTDEATGKVEAVWVADLYLVGRDDAGAVANPKLVTNPSITIGLGNGRNVELNWDDGPLTLIGDPNDYDEAAKVFLTVVMSDAAYEIVAADPHQIRKLVKSGAACDAMGHQWRVLNGGWLECGLCGMRLSVQIETGPD